MRDGRRAEPRWGLALAGWCGAVAVFQVALAAGAPWGAASWGGRHAGVLPGRLRVASAVAAPALGGLAAVAAGRLLGPRGRQRVLVGTTVYAGLSVAANGLSPSPVERAVWAPLSALGTGLAVQACREVAREAR